MEPADRSRRPGRVELLVPTEGHYRLIYERRYDPDVVRWADDTSERPPLREFLAKRRIRLADPGCVERIVAADRTVIGTVTAYGINHFCKDCELGIVIVDPSHWGRGIGPRVLRLFFRILRSMQIETVHLETFADNVRAQKAFMKVGFRTRRTYRDRELRRQVVAMSTTLAPLELPTPSAPHLALPVRLERSKEAS